MNCDLCGSKREPFYKGRVEEVSMTLCDDCKNVGEDVKQVPSSVAVNKKTPTTQSSTRIRTTPEHKEIIQIIRPNYPQIIKRAREYKGLKQEDFAKIIAEKASVIHSLESGKHTPSIDLARKLERHLGITLIEQHEEQSRANIKSSSIPLTIADLIKKR
jgi:putative transcription factor